MKFPISIFVHPLVVVLGVVVVHVHAAFHIFRCGACGLPAEQPNTFRVRTIFVFLVRHFHLDWPRRLSQ